MAGRRSLRILSAAFIACGAFLFAPLQSFATPVFSCGADVSTCNGLTYAVTFDGQFGAQQHYTLWIKTSTSYTGNATDVIRAVALSELDGVSDSSNAALIAAPLGTWDFSLKELNANACSGGGTNSLCAQWAPPGYGVAVLPATIYAWTFGYNRLGAADTWAHIKYEFVEGATGADPGEKVGSLGSWDIAVQVPEGGMTLTLLGCALVGLGALRRKFGA